MGDIKSILVSEVAKEFEIEHNGEKFKFKMRKLPWLTTTGLLSRATSYSGKGTAIVNMDAYYEEYLIAALVEAPWRLEETRFILRKLDPSFGDKLEEFVPKPGVAEGEQVSFFERKSATSSQVETQT